jgi:hypothetical protein
VLQGGFPSQLSLSNKVWYFNARRRWTSIKRPVSIEPVCRKQRRLFADLSWQRHPCVDASVHPIPLLLSPSRHTTVSPSSSCSLAASIVSVKAFLRFVDTVSKITLGESCSRDLSVAEEEGVCGAVSRPLNRSVGVFEVLSASPFSLGGWGSRLLAASAPLGGREDSCSVTNVLTKNENP